MREKLILNQSIDRIIPQLTGTDLLQSIRYMSADFLLHHPRLALYSLVTTITLIIMMIFMLHSGPVLNAQTDHVNAKYFTTIEVKSGDTLWEIAKEYRTVEYASMEDYLDEVKEINHIVGDEIISGGYLTIPYYAEEPLTH